MRSVLPIDTRDGKLPFEVSNDFGMKPQRVYLPMFMFLTNPTICTLCAKVGFSDGIPKMVLVEKDLYTNQSKGYDTGDIDDVKYLAETYMNYAPILERKMWMPGHGITKVRQDIVWQFARDAKPLVQVVHYFAQRNLDGVNYILSHDCGVTDLYLHWLKRDGQLLLTLTDGRIVNDFVSWLQEVIEEYSKNV